MCAMWASYDVRCRYLEHFFLGLSCFGSGGAGLASPGRSALASVPELHVSSFRHASWLNFAGFRSSGDFFEYGILLSTMVCDIAVLLVLVVAVSCLAFWRFWKTIRVILFMDDSLGVERSYALMLSFFIVKFPVGQFLMMYDDRY